MLLPSPLPNETLHSRMCRFLAISGMKTKDFMNYVFADKRYSVHPFLNANLIDLAHHTKETPDELWRFQTLAPLYSHYLPQHKHRLEDLNISNEQLIRSSQISVFKARERPLVKFCHHCALDDIKTHGVAYWHLEHQIVGVEICPHHSIILTKHDLPDRIRIDAGLLPEPSSENLFATKEAYEFSVFAYEKLKLIQNKECNNFEHKNLLNKKGLLTKSGQVRRNQLFKTLNAFAMQVLEVSPDLQPSGTEDFKYWSKVIDAKASQPPFKHMLLEFYLSHLPDKVQSNPEVGGGVDRDKYRVRCLNLLKSGYSVSDIHRLTGKSHCFITALAQAEQIDYGYKPVVLNENVRKIIINMAWKGFHRKVMAKRFKVSLGSVEQIISSVAGLVAWRKQCKYESKRRRHKLTLLRYKCSHPNALRKEIKQNCNAAFFWFYLNEKQWLEVFLPKARKSQQVQRIDWEKRDLFLLGQVKIILKEVLEPISLSQIDKRLGSHKWLLSYRSKLPLTMAYIKDRKLIR